MVTTSFVNSSFRGIPAPATNGIIDFDFTAMESLAGTPFTFTRASSATRFNKDGILEVVPTNVPRFDYDPVTKEPKGLLIEASRTNVMNQMIYTSNGSNISRIDNFGIAPNGIQESQRLIVNGTGSSNWLGGSINSSTVGTGSWSSSVFVKRIGTGSFARYFRHGFRSDGFNRRYGVTVDLETMTVEKYELGGATVGVVSIIDMGNGWYRIFADNIVIGGGFSTATVESWFVSDFLGSNTSTVVGNGFNGVEIWGIQTELNSFSSSPIPVYGTPITRSAEICVSSNLSTVEYNTTEGTIVAEFLPFISSHFISQTAISFDNNSAVNTIHIKTNGGTPAGLRAVVINNNSVQVANNTSNTVNNRVIMKGAFAFKENDFAWCLNGGTPSTDSSGTVPSSITQIRLGNGGSGIEVLFGYIRKFTYRSSRLSNTVIQQLTTV